MVALFRLASCLALPAKALLAGSKPEHALRASNPSPHVDGTTFMVDVPVVQVIMVEEPDSIMEPDAPPTRPANSTTHKGPSFVCLREMEALAVNRTRVEMSRRCEDAKGYTKHAIAALQRANATDALTAIENTFHECGTLSVQCAKEMAPEIELKMRLSGVTVESQCAKKAQEAQSKMSTSKGGHCQENSTKSMVSELAKENLDGALNAAMSGLSTCNSLGSPCDYQIAPILVMQLMQAEEVEQEEAMMRALVSGLRQAAERSAKLTSGDKILLKSGFDKAETSKMQMKHKALSLIDIAEHVHITSERRSVSL